MKHRILREWWNGWLPKLAITNPRTIYFEGFAGPGIYEGGEPGSPVIAIREAFNHSLRSKFERTEVVFFLVEERQDRIDQLQREIAKVTEAMPTEWKVLPVCGDFVSTTTRIFNLLDRKGSQIAPMFAFLDPFGFGDLPMDLVAKILSYPGCDALITFDIRDINRFADSTDHIQAIHRCLGTTEWGLDPSWTPIQRRAHFLGVYEQQVRTRVPTANIRSFELSGPFGPIYYLVGATKNKEGIKVMKRAMWKADPTGQYRFSDRTAGQSTLIQFEEKPSWLRRAGDEVYAQFSGRTVAVKVVEDFVLYHTGYEFRAGILKELENAGKIRQVSGAKRRGTFPNGCTVTFA